MRARAHHERSNARAAALALATFASTASCTAVLGATDVPDQQDAGPDATNDGYGVDVSVQPDADAAGADAPVDSAHDILTPADGGGTDSSDAALIPDADGATGSDAPADTGVTYRATVLGDSPLAYWRVGESSGTVAHDEIASNPSAQYVQGFVLGKPGAIVDDPDTAVLLSGDGTSCVDTSATTVLSFPGSASFSIEVWIDPASLDGTDRHVFIQEVTDTSGKEGYGLFVNTGNITFERWVSGSSRALNVGPPPVGQYTHVVATYDGAATTPAMHVYVNGAEPVASQPDNRAMPVLAGGAYVGCHGGANGFDGMLDEVAVYGAALTSTQAATHYHVGSGH